MSLTPPFHSPHHTPPAGPKLDLPPSPTSPTTSLLSSRFSSSTSSSSERGGRTRHPPSVLQPLSTISDESPGSQQQVNTQQHRREGRLFLSIDSGVRKVRACVLNERLEVVWVEQVDVDQELPEYGTRNGVYTITNEVLCPSELRMKAVDLLLEKLVCDCPDQTMLGRIVAISGATQSSSPHLLSLNFPSLLHTASLANSSHLRLSSILTSSAAFSLPTPPTRSDNSTATHIREIELLVGSPPSTPAPTPATPSSNGSSEQGADVEPEPLRRARPQDYEQSLALKSGRARIVERTGGVIETGSIAAQLMKLRQRDEAMALALAEGNEEEEDEDKKVQGSEDGSQEDGSRGVLERTSTICLESTLLGSLFLGRLAPTDASDAASTSLYNLHTHNWDSELLGVVMGDQEPPRELYEGEQTGAERLRAMLGEVCTDGGQALGTISDYFVERFGFSPDCLIIPFTSDYASSFLAYSLQRRDVALCLSFGDSDCLLAPCSKYVPSAEEGRTLIPHPATRADDKGGEDGAETQWIAMLPAKEAGVGRQLARDLYANGQWNVLSRLTAIVPHGASIGLDSKSFSFFFPRGQMYGAPQGFMRFVSGTRVQEYGDRKVNPRLLLECEFLSLRFRLGRLYLALAADNSQASTDSTPPSIPALTSPYDALRFPPHSTDFIPSRLLLFGAPAQNPAIISLSSTVLGASAFFVDETTNMTLSRSGQLAVEGEAGSGYKTTSSALGAAYKAAWGLAREKGWKDSESPVDDKEPRSFSRFITDIKSAGRDAHEQEERRRVDMEERSRGRSPRNRDREVIASLLDGEDGLGGVDGHLGSIESRWENGNGNEEAEHQGITLVASPDQDEFKFYSSMLREHVRLESNARRGFI